MLKYYFIIIYSLFAKFTIAQRQAENWYFGYNAGLSFATGAAVPTPYSPMATNEGVATLSDANGNLLFYTNGETVYNRLHDTMPNGINLFGSFSTTQSAIIVPFMNDQNRYYIFTVAKEAEPSGLCYSVVNMTLDNGKGDIEIKNVPLVSTVCEKLTAVKHCNGRDTWVIVHKFGSNAFYSYLVTSLGVSSTPVITNIGRVVFSNNTDFSFGCMKASPNGKKLALAHNLLGLDLLDFDNSTGIVSNFVDLPTIPNHAGREYYGVEFSPDSRFLYSTVYLVDAGSSFQGDFLDQYDVSLPNPSAIIASRFNIIKEPRILQSFATLQTGPDGKIYLAHKQKTYISVINSPNQQGTACNFSNQAINLTSGTLCMFGLPNFNQSYLQSTFTFTGACQGLQIQFSYTRPSDAISIKWDFGDPSSGSNNTSLLDNPTHTYSNVGIYTVKLIKFTNCGTDTLVKQVQAGALQVSLGNDTLLCNSSSFTLNPNIGSNHTYLWQNGATTPTLNATQSGTYWVEVKNTTSGCTRRDSIVLTFGNYPQFTLGNDTSRCVGEIHTLNSNLSNTSLLWSTGVTTNSIPVTQSGIYWLEANNNGCIKRDSITILFKPMPFVNLGNDTTLCDNNTLTVNAGNAGASYVWQNGSSSQTYTVTNKGIYYVHVNLNGCVSRDTVVVDYKVKPTFSLGVDTFICQGLSLTLQPKFLNTNDGIYLWNTGGSSNTILVNQSNTYSLTVTNYCGTAFDEIVISKGVCKLYIPTAFTPNNDTKNDVFKTFYGEGLKDFKMLIYNRWGQKVFESNNVQLAWNGTFQGKAQPTGSYIFFIEYKEAATNQQFRQKGTVMLLR